MEIILGTALYALVVFISVKIMRAASGLLSFRRSTLCNTGNRKLRLRPMYHQQEHLCLGKMCHKSREACPHHLHHAV
ncbi:MAG: hypothetical protein ACK5JO_03625 [Halodesulfovibrio sp.]